MYNILFIYSAFVDLDKKKHFICIVYLRFHFVLMIRNTATVTYRGADKSLARPGRKQVNVSVRIV